MLTINKIKLDFGYEKITNDNLISNYKKTIRFN